MSNPTYKMTIDLNVLDHLGINLYSNVAAVLTEMVANAWDAEATEVRITQRGEEEIVIEDNGNGMTIADMNGKFLKVGYRKRDNEPDVTPNLRRPVMGRKGLGKLSLFSIANVVRVESVKEGEKHGLVMYVSEIRESIARKEKDYEPGAILPQELRVLTGTRIALTDLKKSRLSVSLDAMRRRVARRFSVFDDNFKVYVNDAAITLSDREDLREVEYLWHIGDTKEDRKSVARYLKHESTLPDSLQAWDQGWKIKGWIGTSVKPKALSKDEGTLNLNSVVLLSRGRLIQENLLDSINDGRLYTKYLTGEIQADFLDEGSVDIATSDRQRVVEDDSRVIAVKAYLRKILPTIEKQWIQWRTEKGAQEVFKEHPAVREWFDSLKPDLQDGARSLIDKIGSLPIDDESDRKELLKNGLVSFERLTLRYKSHQLADAIDVGAEKLISLISDKDALEAAVYRDIIVSRLEVIKVLRNLVDEKAKEKVLQEHLFEHLWLIDSSWEKANGSEMMESRLLESGVKVDDLTKKEELGRVDIKYRNVMGKHIIVELKKAERKMTLLELQDQGMTYYDKLEKILFAKGEKRPNIEVVFVIGPVLAEEQTNPARVERAMDAISPGSRIVHFDTLIDGALNAYQEYLDKTEELDRISKIVDRI